MENVFMFCCSEKENIKKTFAKREKTSIKVLSLFTN